MLTQQSTPAQPYNGRDTPPATASTPEDPHAAYWAHAAAWLRWTLPCWGVGLLLAAVVMVTR